MFAEKWKSGQLANGDGIQDFQNYFDTLAVAKWLVISQYPDIFIKVEILRWDDITEIGERQQVKTKNTIQNCNKSCHFEMTHRESLLSKRSATRVQF